MARRFWAFTLAETLIVMGIIGVVAALNVPNLNASTGEKEKVAKVKKIYKDLNDAYGRAVAVYGPVDEWFPTTVDQNMINLRFSRFLDFLKATKICEAGSTTKCFYGTYSKLNGGSGPSTDTISDYRIITTDGTSMEFTLVNSQFTYNEASSCPGPYCQLGVRILVDIDGPSKGAHTLGKDFFVFEIDKEYGIIPYGGSVSSLSSTDENLKANCFNIGITCTGWVIENGNMDYLKVDSSGKCPNGTVLSWTNTTCK